MLAFILDRNTSKSSQLPIGTHHDEEVLLAPNVPVPQGCTLDDVTVGTYQIGVNILSQAWQLATVLFEVDDLSDEINSSFPRRPKKRRFLPSEAPKTMLSDYPVDILVVDHSRNHSSATVWGDEASATTPLWYNWLVSAPNNNLPTLIIQIWQSWALYEDAGPAAKRPRKLLRDTGYDQQYIVTNGIFHGGVVTQSRLIVMNSLQSRIQEKVASL